MPTVRQLAEANKALAAREGNAPTAQREAPKPLKLVKSGVSAIEYIVNTARPGEVIHVTDEHYYNPHIWRTYEEVDPLR